MLVGFYFPLFFLVSSVDDVLSLILAVNKINKNKGNE